MTFFIIFSGGILLFYMAIILFASYKMQNAEKYVTERKNFSQNSFTVIVPFRNEIENLKFIYSDLCALRFDPNRFEIIFIDDHSSDGSFEWLEKCDRPENIKLESSVETGKKQALITAISLASANFIVTTDADCRLHPLWLEDIDQMVELKKPKLLVQPVVVEFDDKLVCQFQYYDSLSLLGINLTACALQKFPALASGANLIFQKEAFYHFNPFQDNLHITSGDDMFLLKSFLKHDKESVILNYSSRSLVVTQSEKSWIKLIRQRMRWVGKMKRFSNTTSFLLGLFSVVTQGVLIALLLLTLWHLHYMVYVIVVVWLIKSVIDFIFLRTVARYIEQNIKWFNVFLLEPVYMIFVPVVVVFSMFISPEWKGRKIYE